MRVPRLLSVYTNLLKMWDLSCILDRRNRSGKPNVPIGVGVPEGLQVTDPRQVKTINRLTRGPGRFQSRRWGISPEQESHTAQSPASFGDQPESLRR